MPHSSRKRSHDHHHSGAHAHGHSSERALLLGLMLTIGFAVIELLGGWLSASLALIGDAGHMVTDAAALGLGAIAARLSRRAPTDKHSFGLRRAEIVGALLNGVLMLAVVAWIVFEAIQRIIDEPSPVHGVIVLVVASVGLAVNLVVLKILHGGEQNLNTRGAILHVAGDLLGSLAALASGLVITFTGWTPIDPILSLFISGLILVSTGKLLRDALHVLMEGVPRHVNLRDVGEALAGISGVLEVHDLHIWTIGSANYALAAHLRLESLDRWPEQLKLMERVLDEEFGIRHVTLQPELPYEIAFVDMPATVSR